MFCPFLAGRLAATTPGEVFELAWEGREDEVLVFVPENYVPEVKWPVIVYYPGTGGPPSVGFFRNYTRDRDFILVGMSYAKGEGGTLKYIEERIRAEGVECQKVIRHLGMSLSIDSSRVYLSGFSKGGWFSAMVMDREHAFAGALILGAGVFDYQNFSPSRFTRPTPIYVGVGETDWNVVMALRAKEHFQKLGAQVTFDEWEGLAHSLPAGNHYSRRLEDWLWLQSHRGEDEAIARKAAEWAEAEMKAIEGEEGMVRYLSLERMQQAPLLAHAGGAAEEVAAMLERLRTGDPAVAAEWEVEKAYHAILRDEMSNRVATTLARCAQNYLALHGMHPESHFGKRALADYERAQEMLGDVK